MTSCDVLVSLTFSLRTKHLQAKSFLLRFFSLFIIDGMSSAVVLRWSGQPFDGRSEVWPHILSLDSLTFFPRLFLMLPMSLSRRFLTVPIKSGVQ